MTDEPTTEAPEAPEIELDDRLAALRDHLVSKLDCVTATDYLGELTLETEPEHLPMILAFCKTDPVAACEMLVDVSAVHWPAGAKAETPQESTTGWPTYTEVEQTGRIELSWILRSVSKNHHFRVRASVPDDTPVVASATAQYSSANFLEREVYDLMGVEFTGHPALTRIMMPDDWDGHPHRKDYPLGGVEVMYKGQTVPPPDERDY